MLVPILDMSFGKSSSWIYEERFGKDGRIEYIYMYIYSMWLYIYIYILYDCLCQNAISAIPQEVCRLCSGKQLFMYIHLLIYLHVYEKCFPKTRSLNLAFHVFGMALTAFWKRALHMHIYIYEELLSKTQYTNLGLTFEMHIFGMVHMAFKKKALHMHSVVLHCSIIFFKDLLFFPWKQTSYKYMCAM